MTGQSFSHYTLLEKLGQGGMGIVYKARDARLDRFVAIKLLPPEKMADPDRKRRFIQEARAASALNHPNIITIYDIGSESGMDFIVMEYINGTALDRTLAKRRLPLREALGYAIQIADALTCAHGAGIVHRDLKPGNVIVNSDGLVKVLDFGLAKLIDNRQSGEADLTVAMGPVTDDGMMLGTTPYMSPEQAEGKTIDARSDIFSFGSLLYEMVSGQHPFQGASRLSTLTGILHKEPAPLVDVPADLAKIVARCLRKEVAWRFQHMDDVKVALAELKREAEAEVSSQASMVVASRAPWRARKTLALAAGMALILAIAGLAWWSPRAPRSLPALIRLTSDSGLSTEPALSSDGKHLAYASDRASDGNLDIWVQDTISGSAARLTTDPADDHAPVFSPDGTKIAFRSERQSGGIYLVPTLGGKARLLMPGGREPQFSPDGNWIAYWTGQDLNFGSRLYIMPASGGTPRQLVPQYPLVRSLIWAPDGHHLLFYAYYQDHWDWHVTPFDGGSAVATGALPMIDKYKLGRYFAGATRLLPGVWASNGELIFSARAGDSTGLWRLPVSLSNGRVAGTPERITLGSGEDVSPSLSANGRLAFSSQVFKTHVWMLPADTNAGRVTGRMQQLTDDNMIEVLPHSSDEGDKVVWAISNGRDVQIWLKDLATGESIALTNTTSEQGAPKLSRDGARVVYQMEESGKSALYAISSRPGVVERICAACGRPTHWSMDGKYILFDSATPEPAGAGVLEVASGKISPLVRSKTSLYSLRFSPDDRWTAFHLHTSPVARAVYVAPFRGLAEIPESEWIKVTDGRSADREPYWSPDGNLIYYLSERDGFRCIWAQRVDHATRQPVGDPFAVYHFHSARRSLTNVGFGTGLVGLSIAKDKIVFAQGEVTGNIWMTELPSRR